jgi:predicted ATPase
MDRSEITRIHDQFQSGLWPQFLERIEIKGLRGWQGQSVLFKFPVVAVVGENGAGKSTVLKVAATAYNPQDSKYFPSDFFLDTHWDKESNLAIKSSSATKHYRTRQ